MRYLTTMLAAPVFALLLAGCGEEEPEPKKPGARKNDKQWSDHAPVNPKRSLKALEEAREDLKKVEEGRGAREKEAGGG